MRLPALVALCLGAATLCSQRAQTQSAVVDVRFDANTVTAPPFTADLRVRVIPRDAPSRGHRSSALVPGHTGQIPAPQPLPPRDLDWQTRQADLLQRSFRMAEDYRERAARWREAAGHLSEAQPAGRLTTPLTAAAASPENPLTP